MLDWYELVAKEHQEDLLREAGKRRLMRELRATRGEERSRLLDHPQKTLGVGEIKPRSSGPCPSSGGC